MSDEFKGDVEDSEELVPVSPLDSEGQEQEKQPPEKVDLTQFPEFRKIQSTYDRQIAEIREEARLSALQAEEARRQAELAKEQFGSLLETFKEDDPEAYNALLIRAENDRLRQEKEFFQEQVQQGQRDNAAWKEFWNFHAEAARRCNLDPRAPEYIQAVRENFRNPQGTFVLEEVRREAVSSKIPSSPTAREEQVAELRKKEEEGHFDTLPSGGQSPVDEQRVREYWKKKNKIPAGNVDRHWELKNQYPDWQELEDKVLNPS